MDKDLFSIRLREARQMMDLSMDKLSEMTDGAMTKQSISRYEKRIMKPKRHTLQALAKALDVSIDYFLGTNLNISIPQLRMSSESPLTEEEVLTFEAKLSYWAERYITKEGKAGMSFCFKNPLENLVISTAEDAMAAAATLRQRWNCGDGPIPSVLRLMERKGIKILSTSLPESLLGLSTWANGEHPLMVLDFDDNRTSVERIRFTACHELGHLLLKFPQEPEIGIEKLCNKFAGSFLFPRNTFIEEMGGVKREVLTLEELLDLKELYGVSVAALVHEAMDIGMISTAHYHWWYEEIINPNKKEVGWGHYPFPETIGREKRIDSILGISGNELQQCEGANNN